MNDDILKRLRANPRTQSATREPVTTPRPAVTMKTPRLLWPLVILLGLVVFVLAGWTAVSSPALASMLVAHPTVTVPTPTAAVFWAQAVIAKPTLIPTSLPLVVLPSATPQEIIIPEILLEDTPTPGLMMAEIVPDTPTPEYAVELPQQDAPVLSYSGNKYILVDISEQHMYVYEGDTLVYSFVASTGMNNATRVGNFAVQSKIPSAYGSTWDIWMPYWLGIYWAGGSENGIHALPILSNGGILWEGFLGRPISYGCVVLGTYEAELLYYWADYGTPVEIQW